MKTYTVYMHINKINFKKYIGITCQSVKERWKNGQGYKSDTNAFYKAIKKYSWDGFYHLILFEGLTEYEAKYQEKFLIALYKTNIVRYGDKNGYNLTDGGDGTAGYKLTDNQVNKMIERQSKIVYQYDIFGNYINKYSSCKSAAINIGMKSPSPISMAASSNFSKMSYNYFWSYFKFSKKEVKKKIVESEININALDVFTLEGKYIGTYINATEAFRSLKIPHITSFDKTKRDKGCMAYGYLFQTAKEHPTNISPYISKKQCVNMYDNNGKFINTFKSISDASIFLGSLSYTGRISKCCKEAEAPSFKGHVTVKGYQFRYFNGNTDNINPARRLGEEQGEMVDARDIKTGNIIYTFNSISEAARQLDCSTAHISQSCSGKRRTAGGYYWRKHGDNTPLRPDFSNKKKEKQKKKKRIVIQFDFDGNEIARYSSCFEAARSLNKDGNAGKNISACCFGKNKTSYGYKWEYALQD